MNDNTKNVDTFTNKILKSKTKKTIITIVLFFILLAVAGFIFAYNAESKLNDFLEQELYEQAAEQSKKTPWIAFTKPDLSRYLDAQYAYYNDDIEKASVLFKNLGDYKNSKQLYEDSLFVLNIQTAISNGKADNLIAAIESVGSISEQSKTTYSNLINSLYLTAYDKASDNLIDNYKASYEIFNALPQDFEDVAAKAKIAKIYFDFNTTDSENVYEDTFNSLIELIDNSLAKDILLSQHFIPMFLNGKWETDDGQYYFEQTVVNYKDGTGTHKTNLPKEKEFYAADYDNSSMYIIYEQDETPILMFVFDCIDKDTITITNKYNDYTYTLKRV